MAARASPGIPSTRSKTCAAERCVVTEDGPTKGMPRIETDIDASEVILMLAPETNGEVAVKAWEALSKNTGRDHDASGGAERRREDPLPRRGRAAAQDHFVADLVGSGVREGLLQRRLHQRSRADPVAHACRADSNSIRITCGCALSARVFCVYRPPVDLKTVKPIIDTKPNGEPAGCVELHHAAPKMGHPFHLYRQSADADAQPRWAGGVDLRDRRA